MTRRKILSMIGLSSLLPLPSVSLKAHVTEKQMVVPADLLREIQIIKGCSHSKSIELVRGLHCPIYESENSRGITRFIDVKKGGAS